jgi:hypothetical protein
MKGRSAGVLLIGSVVAFALLMAHTTRSQSNSPASEKSADLAVAPKDSPAQKAAGAQQTASAATNGSASSAPRKLSPEAARWVETTLAKMSLDEKVGQLLFTTYHGSFTPTDSSAYAEMMHDVETLHVGGFINATEPSPLGIVKSQAYPTAVLSNQMQSKSKLPLLIGADFERGTAMRIDEGTSFPTAMAIRWEKSRRWRRGPSASIGSTRRIRT